jgi:outer membrane lipoprotein SlyB
MKRVLIAAVGAIAASALTGCATPDASTDEVVVQKEYRTGSNLPVRHSTVTALSKEDLENQQNSSLNAGPQMPFAKNVGFPGKPN